MQCHIKLDLIISTLYVVHLHDHMYKLLNIVSVHCNYEGVTYTHGDSFKTRDGCNDCMCYNGHAACTEKVCVGRPVLDPSKFELNSFIFVLFICLLILIIQRCVSNVLSCT